MSVLHFSVPPFPTFIIGGRHMLDIGKKHVKRVFTVFDLLYVKSGVLFITEDGIPYEVSEGEYIILVPGIEHYGHKGCEEKTDFIWIHFFMEEGYTSLPKEHIEWSSLVKEEGTITEPWYFTFQIPRYGSVQNRPLINRLLNYLVGLDEYEGVENKLRQQLLFQEFCLQLQKEVLAIPTAAEQVTEQIVAYIREYYNESITMKELSARLHYHPDYMTRSMQKTIGMSPVQYLQQYRISQAKKLLATTNMKVKDISNLVGIQDYTYFSRIFKKQEGLTPNSYRRFVKRDGV
ncbi:helix-turn-helix transcriptional regulator [Priestia abyssalis]|uniref:helix-turn-helix transcriptional regulator n=1 Tax=Priestia abyssalis TaxID=1221450 RepID=UPI0009953BA6|nr:AraC family transcriptional regulator [Priestia abyssalis]